MEQHITFTSDGCQLEGILKKGKLDAGIVICHPHPLYGGSMYNNVVDAIDEGFNGLDYTTLKFNFRGVGNSEGQFDDGNGEQNDISAAADYMKDLGIGSVFLGGHRFQRFDPGGNHLATYSAWSQVDVMAPTLDMARAIVGTGTGQIGVIDLETGFTQQTIAAHDGRIKALKLHPDGRHVITTAADRTLRITSIETGQEVFRLQLKECASVMETAIPSKLRFALWMNWLQL